MNIRELVVQPSSGQMGTLSSDKGEVCPGSRRSRRLFLAHLLSEHTVVSQGSLEAAGMWESPIN